MSEFGKYNCRICTKEAGFPVSHNMKQSDDKLGDQANHGIDS